MNRFEDAVHTSRRDEGELSTEKFEELWLETQTQMFARLRRHRRLRRRGGATSRTSSGRPATSTRTRTASSSRSRSSGSTRSRATSMVEPYLDVLRSGGSKPPAGARRDRRSRPHRRRHLGRRDRRARRRSSTRPRRSPSEHRPELGRLGDAEERRLDLAEPVDVAADRRLRRCRGTPRRGGRSRRRAWRVDGRHVVAARTSSSMISS